MEVLEAEWTSNRSRVEGSTHFPNNEVDPGFITPTTVWLILYRYTVPDSRICKHISKILDRSIMTVWAFCS